MIEITDCDYLPHTLQQDKTGFLIDFNTNHIITGVEDDDMKVDQSSV